MGCSGRLQENSNLLDYQKAGHFNKGLDELQAYFMRAREKACFARSDLFGFYLFKLIQSPSRCTTLHGGNLPESYYNPLRIECAESPYAVKMRIIEPSMNECTPGFPVADGVMV